MSLPKLPSFDESGPLGLVDHMPYDCEGESWWFSTFIACPWALRTATPSVERQLKLDYALALTRWCYSKQMAPFSPVVQAHYAGMIDEKPHDRDACIRANMALLHGMEQLLIGVDGGLTPGMLQEMSYAYSYGITRLWVSLPGWAQKFREIGATVDWEE